MLATLLLFSLPAWPAQEPGADEIVRLRDGRLLVGSITEHDLDGLLLVTARTGGRLRMAWSDLFPGEAERLRGLFGYVQVSAMPQTTAQRILLKNGREVIGRIVRRDARGIEVRTLESSLLVPAEMIAAPPEDVTVDAASVLTPEQFFQERVSGVGDVDAYANFNFAQELTQVFALDRAHERLQLARALASAAGDAPLLARIDGALKQLEITVANRAEAQALEQIRRAMYRERFEEAEALLAAFPETFPQPKLRKEYLDLKTKFGAQRDEAITRYLARNWYDRVVAEVKRRALDREASMDELLTWVESELGIAVRARLVEELAQMSDELQPESLDPLWSKRHDMNPPRHRASYGEGTWILGEERARAGLDATEEEEAADGRSEAQKEMEERVQRYLQNLESQRRAKESAAEGEATSDDWWIQASVTERFQFLLAYYAEFSGDFEPTTFEFTRCSTCAGTGVLETIEISAQGAQNRRTRCPTCHGVGIRRALNFR